MQIRNRVAQVTNTSGLGDISLDGQADGPWVTFQSRVPTGAPICVEVRDGDAYEIFESQLNVGTPYTLTRGDLIDSSTGSRIDLSNANNKLVWLAVAAEEFGPMGGRSRWALTEGTAPDYTATFPTPIRKLVDGVTCSVTFHDVNPSSDVTFAPDDLAAKPVKIGAPLRKIAENRIQDGVRAILEFSADDDEWAVLTPLPNAVKTVSADTYAFVEEDHEQTLVFTSSVAISATIAEAVDQFAAPYEVHYEVRQALFNVTAATSTINGQATVSAAPRQSGFIRADSGNYTATVTGGFTANFLSGLLLSNNATDASNDIDIAAGTARDAGDTDWMTTGVLTKRLDAAWAVGSNAGGRDTGSETSSRWYYVWLIKRPDTGVVDALFSLSSSAPTMPADYTLKRMIGAVYNDGSSNLLIFTMTGAGRRRRIIYDVPQIDLNSANPGTGGTSRFLTVPAMIVDAIVSVGVFNESAKQLAAYLDTPGGTAVSALGVGSGSLAGTGGATVANAGPASTWNWAEKTVRTNSSGQIRSSLSDSTTNARLGLVTIGWEFEF